MPGPRREPEATARAQLPPAGAVYLDHLAHWVADMEAAGAALERLGFVATPFTEHTHSSDPHAPPVPAGSGNRCVMLEEGYLEVLAPMGETSIALEVRAAIERHVGVHLTALAVADAAAERERLVGAGFAQRPAVRLERPAPGAATQARFTVVRPEVGVLPEGRVQFLSHHTPELLWQPRWTAHPNTARRLTDVAFRVADVREAAARYERYVGRAAEPVTGGMSIRLDRGRLTLLAPESASAILAGADLPEAPAMVAYAVECADLARAEAALASGGVPRVAPVPSALIATPPPDLGGAVVFLAPGAKAPWLA